MLTSLGLLASVETRGGWRATAFLAAVVVCLTPFLDANPQERQARVVRNARLNEMVVVRNGTNYRLLGSKSDFSHLQGDCGSIDRFTAGFGRGGGRLDTANDNERIELITLDPVSRSARELILPGEDYSIAYWMFIDKHQKIQSRYTIVGQLQAVNDKNDVSGMPPPFAMVITQDSPDRYELDVHVRSDEMKVSKRVARATIIHVGSIDAGRWHRLDIRLKRGTFPTASLTVSLNGNVSIDDDKINIGYNNANMGMYWQYGIYRKTAQVPFSLSYAGMWQGRGRPPSLCAPSGSIR